MAVACLQAYNVFWLGPGSMKTLKPRICDNAVGHVNALSMPCPDLEDCTSEECLATAVQATLLTPQAEARLPQRDPIKDPNSLLRYALPIDNKPIR